MIRTGMSAREAKLELKVRGRHDPARKPTYRAALAQSPKTKSNNVNKKDNAQKSQDSADTITLNPFNILSGSEEEENNMEIEMDDMKEGRKRILENRTPPKNKKQNIDCDNGPSVKPKLKKKANSPHQIKTVSAPAENEIEDPDEYKVGDEITPSPIITTTINSAKIRKEMKTHNETCGCNECFIVSCHNIENMTKEKLTNTIRNFVQYRRKEVNIESHKEGCMCVNHLMHYKEKHIQFVDKLLEKFQNKDTKTETNNEVKSLEATKLDGKNEIYKEQQKSKSNYNKLSSKTSSFINHQNLTTLT